jgi:hypothetical protein
MKASTPAFAVGGGTIAIVTFAETGTEQGAFPLAVRVNVTVPLAISFSPGM